LELYFSTGLFGAQDEVAEQLAGTGSEKGSKILHSTIYNLLKKIEI
jgi:hypothetical protein